MKMRFVFFRSLTLMSLFGVLFAFTGCVDNSPHLKQIKAQNTYLPSHMAQESVETELFPFVVIERIDAPGKNAHVYVSAPLRGSGHKPTPYHQTALEMATADPAPNVIYIAPPCAFITNNRLKNCPDKYMTTHRYSDRVVHSYRTVIDKYVGLYSLDGLHLIGHSGGAAVASLLAERHPRVKSLRTVAGVLNTQIASDLPGNPDLSGSLNPAEQTFTLAGLPQHHFIGGRDSVLNAAVLNSYVQSIGLSRCVRTSMIPEAGHNRKWAQMWPELMSRPVDCNVPNLLLDLEEEKRALPPLELEPPEEDLPESADEPLTPENAKFLTFFDFDSAEVKESAKQVLAKIVEQARNNEALGGFNVVGHADTSGPEAYNRKLGMRRAKAIREALMKMEVSPARISVSSKGETDLLVPTEDGVREPSNRRVEIMFD